MTNTPNPPAEAPPATLHATRPPPDQHRSRHRTHESRHSRHHSARLGLRVALVIALATLVLVLVFGWVYTNTLRARAVVDAERIAERETEVAQLELELESLRSERDALATGKLPGLIPLEYDRALELGQQYVRNVIFTQTGTSGERRYEYRMIIANPGPAPLRPAVRLLFFDERGIQVGESDVEREAGGAVSDTGSWLQPNETRSYTAAVQIREGSEPRYFLPVIE
jgi:hypothetical protein